MWKLHYIYILDKRKNVHPSYNRFILLDTTKNWRMSPTDFQYEEHCASDFFPVKQTYLSLRGKTCHPMKSSHCALITRVDCLNVCYGEFLRKLTSSWWGITGNFFYRKTVFYVLISHCKLYNTIFFGTKFMHNTDWL